jgi:hypothetical protein
MSEKEVVALSFDLDALKQSMRFAFANDLTVIQELIQNARRAGASVVWVNTAVAESGEPTLSILDNGCGLESFQVLLRIAKSGWGEDVKANESPYGMGFLSAIYFSKHVEVISRRKVLRMDQAQVLSDGQFEVEDFDGELPHGAVTSVTMHGVDTVKVAARIAAIVRGYPISISFNGKMLDRPDALDNSFQKTAVGFIKRRCTSYRNLDMQVYLQGFKVHEGGCYHGASPDVVHLDPTRFFGKFPDRDLVVNQAEMLIEVQAELKNIYAQVLLEAKRLLPALLFMETYRSMAESLGLLDVFNDIDVIPKSFLRQVDGMPHDTQYVDEYMTRGKEQDGFSWQELERGDVMIGDLKPYQAEDDTDNSRRWIFAYAAKAWMLNEMLHEGHWIHGLVSIHDERTVTMKAVGVTRSGMVDSRRLHCIGQAELVLCEDVTVTMDDKSLMLGEPVADEETGQIYVPLSDGKPAYVDSSVVQQLSSYRWDDEFHEDDRDEDEQALNQMARELSTDTPEEHLALTLEAAIASYSSIRSLVCTFEVNSRGEVTVQAMGKQP